MKNSIIDKIISEINRLSNENPSDFFYMIDGYADDYDKESLRSLIMDWEKLERKSFAEFFPKTWAVVLLLRNLNDGRERNKEEYEKTIHLAKEALEELTHGGAK
ncbi:hypothetical protein IKG45_02255 [Candidatus Saccharibacteria bacterium]|nr:hypothetical protein [Candidatus Saccharibacteria bacterium]